RAAARTRPLRGAHDDLEACYASVLTPSRAAIGREDVARLERAFESLSERQREVLTLTRLLGPSPKAVAERLGPSELATRSLLHRALVKLSTLLSDAAARDGRGR